VDTNVRRVVSRAVAGLPDAGPATTAADLVAVEEILPVRDREAARASIAFMEIGALICTARSPKCGICPFRADCAWRLSGAPPATGPSRRPQRYAGTDRQVRGLLLEVLRHAAGPVPRERLDIVWPDEVQRARALAGLVQDGLVEPDGEVYMLAGDGDGPAA
jgi:A/G-specific adenine glycosylase